MLKFLIKVVSRTGFLIKDLFLMDWKASDRFFYYTMKETGMKSTALWMDIMTAVYMYQVSILEYYHYRFFDLSYRERSTWLSERFIRQYSKKSKMADAETFPSDHPNPSLHQKLSFYLHPVFTIDDLRSDPSTILYLLDNPEAKLVFKTVKAKSKRKWAVRLSGDFDREELLYLMESEGFDIVEKFIRQHEDLLRIMPIGLIIIQVMLHQDKEGDTTIEACRLLIPIGNWATAEKWDLLIAPIDLSSGIVVGPAVHKDITQEDKEWHPLTGERIVGFQLPYWDQLLQITYKAVSQRVDSLLYTWEFVLSEEGPVLYKKKKGWSAVNLQIPVKKGMKNLRSFNQSDKIL